MTAAHQIDEHVVHKIEIMAYTLNPHPCAKAIKMNLNIWRQQQETFCGEWVNRHPDRPNKNISMRFVGSSDLNGEHFWGEWHVAEGRQKWLNLKCPYHLIRTRYAPEDYRWGMRWD